MPGSHFVGDWSEGSKILFLGPGQNGPSGMVSRIRTHRPHQHISIEHPGIVQDGKEHTSGDSIKGWAGALENYTFRASNPTTELLVERASTRSQAMTNHFTPRVGAVFSADIAVPEHDREVRFYSRVLSTGANPLWREDDLMNNLGAPVIGLGERSGEYADLPLQWMPHIQVADVGASVRRARDLGGTVLLHPKDDDGNSLWAVLRDPGGAAFGVIPVVPPEMVPEVDGDRSDTGVGRIAWLDLTVSDAPGVRDFYREVTGWSAHDVEMEAAGERYADFNMVGRDGRPEAGICHARGVNADLPPVWMIYLPVGDLAESLVRVEEEGGEVLKTMRGEDGGYVYAAIRDPVGVWLALVPGGS